MNKHDFFYSLWRQCKACAEDKTVRYIAGTVIDRYYHVIALWRIETLLCFSTIFVGTQTFVICLTLAVAYNRTVSFTGKAKQWKIFTSMTV